MLETLFITNEGTGSLRQLR